MFNPEVRRLTGGLGLLAGALILLPIPLYFMYSGAPPDWNILTRIMLTIVGCTVFVAFLAGLRRLITDADASLEWIATLAFAAGLLYTTAILVSLSLEAGTAIATEAPIDPTVHGALAPGQFLLYGSIGRLMTALLLVSVGFCLSRSRLTPPWTARAAYLVAALNIAFVPSMFFGDDAAHFYSAVGWGSTAFAAAFLFYWVIAVSVVLVRTSSATSSTSSEAASRPV